MMGDVTPIFRIATKTKKHRSVKEMLGNPRSIQISDIAQYAVMNCSDNDHNKKRNIEDLIAAYVNAEQTRVDEDRGNDDKWLDRKE